MVFNSALHSNLTHIMYILLVYKFYFLKIFLHMNFEPIRRVLGGFQSEFVSISRVISDLLIMPVLSLVDFFNPLGTIQVSSESKKNLDKLQ